LSTRHLRRREYLWSKQAVEASRAAHQILNRPPVKDAAREAEVQRLLRRLSYEFCKSYGKALEARILLREFSSREAFPERPRKVELSPLAEFACLEAIDILEKVGMLGEIDSAESRYEYFFTSFCFLRDVIACRHKIPDPEISGMVFQICRRLVGQASRLSDLDLSDLKASIRNFLSENWIYPRAIFQSDSPDPYALLFNFAQITKDEVQPVAGLRDFLTKTSVSSAVGESLTRALAALSQLVAQDGPQLAGLALDEWSARLPKPELLRLIPSRQDSADHSPVVLVWATGGRRYDRRLALAKLAEVFTPAMNEVGTRICEVCVVVTCRDGGTNAFFSECDRQVGNYVRQGYVATFLPIVIANQELRVLGAT